ncbi:MAG: hypothetical protein HUU37_04955 [Bdellovibrionales bacterium]|nr:hypothetical protein [Bdellovibrionales bacterium]
MRKSAAIIVLASAFLSGSCGNMDPRPNVHGDPGLVVNPGDTSASSKFRFNHAFRDDASADADVQNLVMVQGGSGTSSSIMAACNAAGSGCVCDFYDATSTLMGSSTANDPAASAFTAYYETTGNYVSCFVPAALNEDNVVTVRVRNSSSTAVSDAVTVYTSLNLAQILNELDPLYVRTVYSYQCTRHFLAKTGTNYDGMDCSDQGANDFQIYNTNFTYYVYGSVLASNTSSRMVDLYYNQASTQSICGLWIKQYDCVNILDTPLANPSIGALDAKFGLYSQQKGLFQNGLQMQASGVTGTETYGFYASTESIGGETVCPPGMEMWTSYNNTIDASAIMPSSNAPDVDIAAQTNDATNAFFQLSSAAAPTAPYYQRNGAGDCNGTACSAPNAQIAAALGNITTAASGTTYCVIPESAL